MTLLERLKIETRPAHDRIEAAIDLDRRIASRDAYRDLLISLFTASTRPGKVDAAEVAHDRTFFRDRCKTELLPMDLAALGLEPDEIEALPQCRPLMPLPAPEAVLGSMYVVEGSTLGGTIIAREVERRLGLTPEDRMRLFPQLRPGDRRHVEILRRGASRGFVAGGGRCHRRLRTEDLRYHA
jgi:heme oxygenase